MERETQARERSVGESKMCKVDAGNVLRLILIGASMVIPCAAQSEAPLPEGVKTVWDLACAWRATTPTREKICINGLWRAQPAADAKNDTVPSEKWGFVKVPGSWNGSGQTAYPHAGWKGQALKDVNALWYQREITIPNEWAGRRIAVSADCVNSVATLFIDGRRAGEIRFPSGEADITACCKPGAKHELSLCVVAMPLKAVTLSFNDTAQAKEIQGTVARRGLCGDVYLSAMPAAERIGDVKVDTSTRKGEITFEAALPSLKDAAQYVLRAQVLDNGKSVAELSSAPFKNGDVKNGRFAFTAKWMPPKLWDIHTPQNMHAVSLSLLDAEGKVLDTFLPERFGFREFWIEGRDFYLNGSRIFLSCMVLSNGSYDVASGTYDRAKESMSRLKSMGINLVYTHNYGCEPGSHLSFAEALRAADDAGMLVAFTQPHFGHYKDEWKEEEADKSSNYARHAERYVRMAQNHPSVVFYAMSHNSTGYDENMNPEMIDGINDPRGAGEQKNVKLALRAEAVVKRFDPERIVYHHSSGNLGAMHTNNFYPNWVPIQEMSDWFEHWATKGVKPILMVEYDTPSTWDWTMYRGWYKGKRSYGGAQVPWEACFAEWNSQLLGDRAFQLGEPEKKNLRWEAKQFREGKLWKRWDYPYHLDHRAFDDRYTVMAMYITDNWRAFRGWGMSGNSPTQEPGFYWRLRDGVDKSRKNLKVDWEKLQRPGLSPDYDEQRSENIHQSFERSDWIPTVAAQALLRNNLPLLAYIAGKPAHFTGKDHNFLPGETVEKQVIVINNSRETVSFACEWTFGLPLAVAGKKSGSVKTGEQERIPLSFPLPVGLAPGKYEIVATVKFGTGETQQDAFAVNVVAKPQPPRPAGKIALFDPKGETGRLLKGLGIPFQGVEANADLSGYDVVIVGKGALTPDGPGPDLGRVRDGLKAIVFEQTTETLERRFGFRATEYGLRQVFKRVSDHPALAGIEAENLHDWRGEATILPPRLKYKPLSRFYGAPGIKWCDVEVARLWRCGCWGNVASVLIEKPVRGDFLPILDGGFSLQFSPLMEFHEGKGMVLFCQMDVTGRTDNDPAAERLMRNIMDSVSAWKAAPSRKVLYAGEPAGKDYLEKAGVSVSAYEGGNLAADQALVVGPGGGQKLAANAAAIGDWVKAGGHVLAIGLDEGEANAFLPFKVGMKKAEHIAACFEPFGVTSPLAGIGPADIHNRDPKEIPLVSGGAGIVGAGVLAKAENANVVFCQLVPWQFDYSKQYNLKRTFRRVSCAVARLLAGMGAAGSTPLLDRFKTPVDAAKSEKRWLDGLYLDQPEEWDDPYRFFCW
jgi:beta-galactosidase/beta-glucuronidase